MSKLTADQAQEIAELRERGWSYKRLALRFAVSTGAIHYRCMALGATSPRSTRLGRLDTTRRPHAGFGKPVRWFTPAEDVRLLALAHSGAKTAAIAAAMGRARSSIRVRLLTLELREDAA